VVPGGPDDAASEACRYWISITGDCRRPWTRNSEALSWRRFGDVAVSLAFRDGVLTLQRLESLRPHAGEARRCLEVLKALSNRFGIPISGHALAHATAECPRPHQRRLKRFYRSAGFSVGSAPHYVLYYPPLG
jgi:hypothetical protein